MDGVVLDAAEATIPVTDEGLLRGDGVFEVIRVYAGRPFALDQHLTRMIGSAAGMRRIWVPNVKTRGLPLPVSVDAELPDLEGVVPWLRTEGIDAPAPGRA